MKIVYLSIIFSFLVSVLSFSQKMELILVNGGEFTMGNDFSPNKDDNESPEHKVTLDDFQIGKYEVTYEQFDRFCVSTGWIEPDDAGFGRGQKPVMNVSWESAVMYCNWLSRVEKLDKCYKDINRDSSIMSVTCDFSANGYRLPTEAEWEYAAKGGNKSKAFPYSGGIRADDVAWFAENSDRTTHNVGTKNPNEIGIHDMNGNVREWVWDYYSKKYYTESPSSNPRGPDTGAKRVYRGGGWTAPDNYLRLTARQYMVPNKKNGGITGFRVVRKP